MSNFLIITAVIAFLVILYLVIFSFPKQKRKSNLKKKFKENIPFKNSKSIDKIYQSQNKDLLYNQHFFSGKKILITGDLKYFKNRNDLAKLLWENGAIVENVYNSSIDILIVGNANIDSLKIKSAFYLNIKVITEEEILNYFPNFKPYTT